MSCTPISCMRSQKRLAKLLLGNFLVTMQFYTVVMFSFDLSNALSILFPFLIYYHQRKELFNIRV